MPAAYDSDSFERDDIAVPELVGGEDEGDDGDGGGDASDDTASLQSESEEDKEEAPGDAGAIAKANAAALPRSHQKRTVPSPRVFGRKAPASRGADGSKASSVRMAAPERVHASEPDEATAKGKVSPAKASPTTTKKKRAAAAAADAVPAKKPKSAEAKTSKARSSTPGDSDAPKGKRGGFRRGAGRPKGALGKKNRERVEQGLEPELTSGKKPKKPKRPKTQAEVAREAKGTEVTTSAADRAAAVKALAKKGPIVKRAAADRAAAAKAAEAVKATTPPPKVRPWNRKPIALATTVGALALTPSPSPRRNASLEPAAPPSGSGDPWTARKLDNAVARQRERERRWEKPIDSDAGYDDDFAVFEFGDGTPDATPTKVQTRLAKVVDMATTVDGG